MTSKHFQARILTAILFLLATIFAAAQELKKSSVPEEAGGITITLLKVTPKLDDAKNPVGIASENSIQTAKIDTGEAQGEVFAKIIKQTFSDNEYFRFTVENHSGRDFYIFAYDFNDVANCEISNLYPTNHKNPLLTVGQKLNDKTLFYRAKNSGEDTILIFATTKPQFDLLLSKGLSQGVSQARGELPGMKNIKSQVSSGGSSDIFQGVSKGKIGLDLPGEFKVTANLGNVHNSSGDQLQTFEYYDAILSLTRCQVRQASGEAHKAKLKNIEANFLNGRGLKNYQSSRFDNAVKDYKAAAELMTDLSKAKILSNLGQVYATLNQTDEATRYYNEALQILDNLSAQSAEVRTAKAIIANNKGVIYEIRRDYKTAQILYSEALKIEKELNQNANVGVAYNNLARVALAAYNRTRSDSKIREALSNFKLALFYSKKANNLPNIASVYNNIGLLYMLDGRSFNEANESFNRSAKIFDLIGNRAAAATALGNLMFAANEQDEQTLAVIYGKRAVNLLQEIRGEISEKNSQQSFLRSRADTYRLLAELLVKNNRLPEAERVLAMLKEEEFSEFTRRDAEAAKALKKRIPESDAEQATLDEYIKNAETGADVSEKIAALETKLGEHLTKSPNEAFPKQAELNDLRRQRENAEAVMNLFFANLRRATEKNPEYFARVREIENSLKSDLKTWQERFGERVAVVSTIVGKENLNLILTTANNREAHISPVSENDLNKLVVDFRQAVQNDKIDPRQLGGKLYDLLLPASFVAILKRENIDTLVWSLDGNLRYVPVAALWNAGEKKYLAEQFASAIITLASVARLSDAANNKQAWRILGAGVSKETTIEEKESDGNTRLDKFPALDAVPQELFAIVSNDARQCGGTAANAAGGTDATPENGALAGCRWLDADFTKQKFENFIAVKKFQVVHLASHFNLLAGKNAAESYLLLGGDANRQLKISELSKRDGFFQGIELLTLSACETAFAGADASGAEIESFGAAAQKIGAKAVLATLWSVADASTRDFMVNFYKFTKESSPTKAEAARLAQLALIYGKYTPEQAMKARGTKIVNPNGAIKQPSFQTDANAPFAHPFYWSPFILIGNWR